MRAITISSNFCPAVRNLASQKLISKFSDAYCSERRAGDRRFCLLFLCVRAFSKMVSCLSLSDRLHPEEHNTHLLHPDIGCIPNCPELMPHRSHRPAAPVPRGPRDMTSRISLSRARRRALSEISHPEFSQAARFDFSPAAYTRVSPLHCAHATLYGGSPPTSPTRSATAVPDPVAGSALRTTSTVVTGVAPGSSARR